MKINVKIIPAVSLFLPILLGAGPVTAQTLTPVWVELGDGGQAIARVVVNSPRDCPAIKIDDAEMKMTPRQPVPDGLRPACELTLPANAKHAVLSGQTLALPRKNPLRIITLWDTGCRIKGKRVQGCNDPGVWPFAQVAGNAAEEKADLVIHVGDYLYREDMCPADAQDKCGGNPSGDNWETWNADFFAPAAKLLAAAPWAFSRGNHEDCKRAWRGWFYYLDPRPLTLEGKDCKVYSAPYVIRLGKFELAMLDSSPVNEDQAEEKQVAEYAKQLTAIEAMLHGKRAWLADHHPFWGLKTEGQKTEAISAPLEAAWDRVAPKHIGLILSGHVHLFEILSFAGTGKTTRPPQIVAGDGGTALAEAITEPLNGAPLHGAKIVASESQREFGYTMMTRVSKQDQQWKVTLENRQREVLLACSIQERQAACDESKNSTKPRQ